MTYRPTTAVWHDSSARGTPSDDFVWARSSRSWAAGVNQLSARCATHSLQQPQVGVLYTVIAIGELTTSARARRVTRTLAAPTAAARSHSRREIMKEMYTGCRNHRHPTTGC